MEPTLTIEAFVGHRVWRIVPHPDGSGPVLASVGAGDLWESTRLDAFCRAATMPDPTRPARPHHGVAPDVACTCGVYASIELRSPEQRGVWARGKVRLWGRVVEGTRGFRAQRAELIGPVELILGMGKGPARCRSDRCRAAASRVGAGPGGYAAWCRDHAPSEAFALDRFVEVVSRSMYHRYGVDLGSAGGRS